MLTGQEERERPLRLASWDKDEATRRAPGDHRCAEEAGVPGGGLGARSSLCPRRAPAWTQDPYEFFHHQRAPQNWV